MAPLGPANVLTELEVRAVLAATCNLNRRRRYPTAVRNHALILALWRGGLRCSEALSLRRQDVQLDLQTMRVLGKGRRHRVVGIHHELAAGLERWMLLAPVDAQLVFTTLKGGRLSDGYVREMLARKGQQAGVARVHPHAFRATLAVELMQEGVAVAAIRDVLGHFDIAVTDAYLRRVFPAEAIAAVINRA